MTDGVACIPLTMGLHTVIDIDDLPLVQGVNWLAIKIKGQEKFYAARMISVNGQRKRIFLHRLLLSAEENYQVDHKDGNGLNNRRENIRKATSAQNNQNKGLDPNNTSGFKGVSWHKDKKKWRSSICYNGNYKHLGYFDTPELAHNAYCKASAKFHGEFGRTS